MRQYIPTIRWLQQLLDLAAAQAALATLTLYHLGDFPEQYRVLGLVSTLLMIVLYQGNLVYHIFRAGGFWSELRTVLKAWVAVLLALAVIGFAGRLTDRFSPEILLAWAIAGGLAQSLVHWGFNVFAGALRARGVNQRRALLVGAGDLMERLAGRLRRSRWLGIQVVGTVELHGEPGTGNPTPDGAAASIAALPEVVRRSQADLVYITLPLKQAHRIEEILGGLIPLHVDVHWVPDVSSLQLLNQGAYEVEGQPVLFLSDSRLAGWQRLIKWLEDKILATVLLVATSPLMLLIAAAIKLTSGGPVLFKQRRAGRNGQEITIWKFRSMVKHRPEPGELPQAVRQDPRLTPIGGFLRRTSLDELPQFFNVLQGRMSIVGPRPHAVVHDNYYANQISAYMLRHRVKPGMTGWAQVNGWRGETDVLAKMQMRVNHDLFYINNWSLSFDLLIITMTLWRQIITGKSAY